MSTFTYDPLKFGDFRPFAAQQDLHPAAITAPTQEQYTPGKKKGCGQWEIHNQDSLRVHEKRRKGVKKDEGNHARNPKALEKPSSCGTGSGKAFYVIEADTIEKQEPRPKQDIGSNEVSGHYLKVE
ncbi:MAG: hypothetical protein L0Y56_16910 [Nitrospira sp.]|nr:hypothetical protein [Nitrospira sp.]